MTIQIFTHDECLQHDPGTGHPENPQRLQLILKALETAGFNSVLEFSEAPLGTDAQILLAHDDQLAVEIPTTFEVIAGWEDSFWGVPLKKGQVMRTISWGIYDIEEGKFKRIRTARYKRIHDWQFED